MASEFRLILRLHTPVIMPVAAPRLDVMLHEAMCRLHQDWTTLHDLPLEKDPETGVYRASQLILGTTATRPLTAISQKLVTSVFRQDLHLAHKVKARFMTTFPDGNKLTPHQGIGAPYALFYGVGDGQQCAELLSLLSGIGREHARHYGAFSVERLESSTAERWRLRPWPSDHPAGWAPCTETFSQDQLCLRPRQAPAEVMRPPRLLREVLHAH